MLCIIVVLSVLFCVTVCVILCGICCIRSVFLYVLCTFVLLCIYSVLCVLLLCVFVVLLRMMCIFVFLYVCSIIYIVHWLYVLYNVCIMLCLVLFCDCYIYTRMIRVITVWLGISPYYALCRGWLVYFRNIVIKLVGCAVSINMIITLTIIWCIPIIYILVYCVMFVHFSGNHVVIRSDFACIVFLCYIAGIYCVILSFF